MLVDAAVVTSASSYWGEPTPEAAEVLRTLEPLGFELVANPPPSRMLRACAAAKPKMKGDAHCASRNTRCAHA